MKKHCCWISYKWVNKIESGSHIKDIARKTIFPFSKCSEKMDFPKKSNWNMIFLVSTGKMAFLFPKNMILFFRDGKWNDLKKKIHGNMIFSSNVLKMWFFQKKPTGMRSFLYHQERWYFLFPKIWHFFYTRKVKDDLSKKCMEIWCFLYIR